MLLSTNAIITHINEHVCKVRRVVTKIRNAFRTATDGFATLVILKKERNDRRISNRQVYDKQLHHMIIMMDIDIPIVKETIEMSLSFLNVMKSFPQMQ